MLCAQSVNSDTIAATYYTGTYHLRRQYMGIRLNLGRSYLGLCTKHKILQWNYSKSLRYLVLFL